MPPLRPSSVPPHPTPLTPLERPPPHPSHILGTTPERTRAALFRDYKNDDFRPRAGSALVDAGAAVDCTYACDMQTHIWPIPGAPATIGAAPDIGAYEYPEPW